MRSSAAQDMCNVAAEMIAGGHHVDGIGIQAHMGGPVDAAALSVSELHVFLGCVRKVCRFL